MANLLLKDTLSGKVAVDDIVNWLTTDDVENPTWDSIRKSGCSQCEFLIYFWNYLREQTKSILQRSYAGSQTPVKPPQSYTALSGISTKKNERPPGRVSLFGTSPGQISGGRNVHVHETSKIEVSQAPHGQAQSNISVPPREISPIISDDTFKKNGALYDGNAVNELQTSLNSPNFGLKVGGQDLSGTVYNRTPDKLEVRRNLSAGPNLSPNTITSTPIIKKRYSNNFNRTFGSSDEQRAQNVTRNSKSTPRQNASLADFITIDTKSSKKNSAKKTNTKIHSTMSSDGEGSISERLSVTEESFPKIEKKHWKKQRRIKPTKLNVSNGEGSNENATFGVLTRPQISNPQFLEVTPTQKADEVPFETERDLLRLERQKQQNILTNQPIDHVVEPNVSLKSPSVQKLSRTVLTPSLELVDNRQALDVLVKIYSSLLDYNLILNPMRELHFVISLVTVQHFPGDNTSRLPSNHDNLEEKSSEIRSGSGHRYLSKAGSVGNRTPSDHEESNECVNIEFLNEELGCQVLNDNTAFTIDVNVRSQDDSDLKVGKAFDNLTRSILNLKESDCTNETELTKGDEKSQVTEREYFQTIHNCIYFSTNFLNTQKVLLSLLDRATLKLLSENKRIAIFLPDLQEYLHKCYKSRLNDSSRLKQPFNAFSTTEANVSFQIDTDNRENFPSHDGFLCFRKQRDLFYEVLRIWDNNHSEPRWVFSIALGGKIKKLVTLSHDAANYCHFARLFKSQLLLSCIRNGMQENPIEDESFSFLKSLTPMDPTKLTRLQERLVTRVSTEGPVPPPSFPGVQEFYKDFILHAADPTFYAHLQDCFVHEIMELNDTQFTGSEIEDTETMVDEETKQNFITCISSLRLLAKMLGFLVSLPYRGEVTATESVLATQLELRNRVLPPLNLHSCLQNAISNGKLALTIPWMVKYLAMLDPLALRLSYYRKVLEMLCYIYCESKHNSEPDNPLSLQVVILLKFSIGWFFELCNFPMQLYFTCRTFESYQRIKSIGNLSPKNVQSTLAMEMVQLRSFNQSSHSGPCADSLDIVDERTLYLCCPFLAELRTVLTVDHSNLNNVTSIRHITPVTSGFEKPFIRTSTNQLQLQLEDAFFHGQPSSTRKTVDFVSERVASTCVKHICNSVLPRVRKENLDKFQNVISQHTSVKGYNIKNLKSIISEDIQSIALRLSADVKTESEADLVAMCETRTTTSIEALLAEDTLPSVKEMCVQIAIRMAREKVKQWMQSHINDGSLFIKDMEMAIDKASKDKCISTEFENRIHNNNAASPTDVINEIREIIWDLVGNAEKSVTLESILKCLNNLYETLTERADLLPGPKIIIGALSVDLALFLIVHRSDILVTEVHEKLIRVWKLGCLNLLEEDSILSRILSPRNIMMLGSTGHDNAWLPLGQLIRRMLREEVLTIEVLSDQCTALLSYDWTAGVLKNVSKCIAEGIKDFKSTNEEGEKMNLLLQWIAETCHDLEFPFY